MIYACCMHKMKAFQKTSLKQKIKNILVNRLRNIKQLFVRHFKYISYDYNIQKVRQKEKCLS